MEFLKFNGEFASSYWEFSAEINKNYANDIDEEILDLIEKLNFYVKKASVGNNFLEVSYFLPFMKNKTFITKKFIQVLTTGLIKSITIDVFNSEHIRLFTIVITLEPLKCPNWFMDLNLSDGEILTLNIKYEINSVKIV